jgi:hypothetical protein
MPHSEQELIIIVNKTDSIVQFTSNIEALSLNHYCRKNTTCISYSLCVYVFVGP